MPPVAADGSMTSVLNLQTVHSLRVRFKLTTSNHFLCISGNKRGLIAGHSLIQAIHLQSISTMNNASAMLLSPSQIGIELRSQLWRLLDLISIVMEY